ncbi:MAG TPA: TonB-dependent receptor [Vicinamibacterales bacterium]|nr:TonB-dependent receptor [Vicinamibacterales bacterium]
MSIVRRVGFAVCLLLAAESAAWAQDGVITGRIADPSGATLPGVDVALTSPALVGGRSVVSDEQGTYRFALLPPGVYSVRFQLQGFGTVVREGITLTPGFTSNLNIVMDVGAVAETVTVVGESPIIDVTNAVVATNFSKELTNVLPTGHDVFSVLAITPGVQVTAPDVGGSRAGLRAQFRVFGSTSQWNVIEGAIMASLQYEDPDVYEEVQVAGASKGADAPVGGSFNNFIVKSGGNDIHGLFFYDREPLDLQSSNLSPELEAQGVTNTSSVARYQSVHADIGGPIIRDKFWWFYAFRNLNSDNWTPGYYNTDTGLPEPVYTTLQNHATKLNFRLNSSHTLTYSGQYNSKSLPNSGASAFVDSASTSLTDFPYWIQGATLTSILSNRSTLEVKWGEFGWKWWQRPGADEISRMDLDTQLQRGGRNAPFIDRSHHMNISGVYSLITSGARGGDHNIRLGYGYLYEGAPYEFIAPKDSVRTFWRGGFRVPAEIETYDTPFSFENEVTHQWAFINDTWTTGRFSFNGGVRLDSFKPYYEEQGKDGAGPYQDTVTYPGFEFHRLNGFVPRLSVVYDMFGTGRTALKLAYGRYSYNAGTMTNANSMMAGFVNPMARTTRRYRWDGTLPYVPNPANLLSTQGGANRELSPDLKLPYTDEFVVGLDQQLMRDTTLRFNYVRKLERNRMKLENEAIPFEAYNIPVAFIDRGRDFASAADDQVLTLYSLDRAYVGQRADLLMNDPLFTADYETYNVEVVKRLSGRSQVLTGFDISHYDTWGFASAISQDIATDTSNFGVPQDPNRLAYNNRQDYWHWQFKFLGSYELPWEISTSASVRLTKGEPYGRTGNTTGLTQGTVNLTLEPIGTFFYPTVRLLDLRFSKSVRVANTKLEGLVDIFNVNNSPAILSVNTQTGASFGNVLTTVNPRIVRLGVRWSF